MGGKEQALAEVSGRVRTGLGGPDFLLRALERLRKV